MNAKEASVGSYILHKREPFRILKNESISVGTHSHSKTKLTLVCLKSGRTDIFACSHHENFEEAEVNRCRGQVMSVDKFKGEAQVMNLETYETLAVNFPEKMAEDVVENGTIAYVEFEDYRMVTEARPPRP